MCLRRLQKSQNLDARQIEYLVLISDATNHIKVVVQDLLSYAQEADKKKEKVDLRKVVMDAANLVQPRLNRNNIHYHVDLPVTSCFIYGVKNHLVQVIVNGIINSIDAIDQGGNIYVSLGTSKDSFLITIADDGVGISPEVAAKAFDPFFTTKGKKGTGLGLYVSFGIVKAHHGQIELKANLAGHGTVLTIDLPKERTHEYSHS
jgi:signal transduction histidine kinase